MESGSGVEESSFEAAGSIVCCLWTVWVHHLMKAFNMHLIGFLLLATKLD